MPNSPVERQGDDCVLKRDSPWEHQNDDRKSATAEGMRMYQMWLFALT